MFYLFFCVVLPRRKADGIKVGYRLIVKGFFIDVSILLMVSDSREIAAVRT